MKNKHIAIVLGLIISSLFVTNVSAGGAGGGAGSTKSKDIKPRKKSSVSNTTIKLNLKDVKNTITGNKNTGIINIGRISSSDVSDSRIEVTSTKTIKNTVDGGSGSTGIINMGVIKNSEGVKGSTKILVKQYGMIDNYVKGENSTAIIDIGMISNVKKADNVTIDVTLNNDVVNKVTGDGSAGLIGIGVID